MLKSKEARRRLKFFVNSLFMDMSDAPFIMTPYYSEESTYTNGDFEECTDTLGVSILLYLQTLFRTDWNKFLESYQYMMKKVWIHCIRPKIRRRMKIQNWTIPINLCIATLTFVLHILIISGSIVL